MLVNFGSACVAILGTVLALILGSVAGDVVVRALLPATAGGFVYIASADLIPELQEDRSLSGLVRQTLLIAAGIAVMGALTLVE